MNNNKKFIDDKTHWAIVGRVTKFFFNEFLHTMLDEMGLEFLDDVPEERQDDLIQIAFEMAEHIVEHHTNLCDEIPVNKVKNGLIKLKRGYHAVIDREADGVCFMPCPYGLNTAVRVKFDEETFECVVAEMSDHSNGLYIDISDILPFTIKVGA